MKISLIKTNENPEAATSGFSIPFFAMWLKPQADCSSLPSVQPFADEICNNTSHNRRKKCTYFLHLFASFPPPCRKLAVKQF
jgi:hypothetical protein